MYIGEGSLALAEGRMSIIGWIVIGALAGWIAGFITKGGYGLVGDIICGIVGAVIAGWITGVVLGRDMVNGFNLETLIVAIIGAAVVILVSRALTRGRATA
jgi:uncharacterized membrane protein YeaQ/YmgE (transglycosylase-associated protein family)